MRKLVIVGALACLAVFLAVGGAGASTPGADARVTVDCVPDAGCGDYVSAITLATADGALTGQKFSIEALTPSSCVAFPEAHNNIVKQVSGAYVSDDDNAVNGDWHSVAHAPV